MPFFALTTAGLYPTKVILNFVPGATFSENFPSKSVTVPWVVLPPSMMTLAPITVSPFWSTTLPLHGLHFGRGGSKARRMESAQ